MNEWISVKDELPKGGEVLVLLEDGRIRMDFTFIDGGSYDWWNFGQDRVTHWMPLPERPGSQ